jgi:hypothetical protein
MESCKIRSTCCEARWIFRAGDVTYLEYHGAHGNALPDIGMQERSAAGAG